MMANEILGKTIFRFLILVSVCINGQMLGKYDCNDVEQRNLTIRTELKVCIGTYCTLVCPFREVIKWQCGPSTYFWRQDGITVKNNEVFPDDRNVSTLYILADKDMQCACTYTADGQVKKHSFHVHIKRPTQDNQTDGSYINNTVIGNAHNQTKEQSYYINLPTVVGIVMTPIVVVVLMTIVLLNYGIKCYHHNTPRTGVGTTQMLGNGCSWSTWYEKIKSWFTCSYIKVNRDDPVLKV